MKLKINEEWEMETYDTGIRLNKMGVVTKGKTAGEPYIVRRTYHTTFKKALVFLVEEKARGLDELKGLVKMLEDFKKDIESMEVLNG